MKRKALAEGGRVRRRSTKHPFVDRPALHTEVRWHPRTCALKAFLERAVEANPERAEGAQAAVGRRCASCHTDTYAGTKAVARIAAQREEYLLKALHDYKSGVRSGGGMAAMAEVAYPLSEEEITALAHYLAHM